MQGTDPRAAGQLSPDGQWRWDGVRWVPAMTAAPAPQPPMPPPLPSPFAPSASGPSRRSWLATGGGITALAAMPFIVAGCVLPYIYYNDTSSGPVSSAVFNAGYPGAWPYAVEPIVVVVVSLAVAILLIVAHNHTARALASGALLAFGLQTFTLFFGYTGGSFAFGHMGAGGPVGMVGAVMLIVGGAAVAASLLGPRHTTT
jgi:hypothetical protein